MCPLPEHMHAGKTGGRLFGTQNRAFPEDAGKRRKDSGFHDPVDNGIILGRKMLKMKNRSKQFMQLGLTVGYYRKLKGMTQQDLADAVNLSRTHISNLEAPHMSTSISLEKLFDIADALGVPMSKLLDFRE